jgi:LmbE family N-acetylglucosaminyl deacetylase
VLGPRPNDYHPDHRNTSVLVQDAAYMVTVPNVVALVEHLPRNPIFLYTSDRFQRPYPFTPDVVVDTDAVADQKIAALASHVSQMFEWLPYNAGTLDQVPADEAARQTWFDSQMRRRFRAEADRFRAQIVERYGAARGEQVQTAEAFEVCEYGAPLTPALAADLFPF